MNFIIKILRSLIMFALLTYVGYKAGLFNPEGRGNFADLIKTMRMPYFWMSIGLSVILNLASAIKWYMLLLSRKIHIKLHRLLIYYYIGKFFNLVLPTSLGGDVVRIYKLADNLEKKEAAAASVIVERFTGMITLTAAGALSLLLNLKYFNNSVVTFSLGSCILAVTVIGWLILDERPFNALKKVCDSKFMVLKKMIGMLASVKYAIKEYSDDNRAIWVAIINSVIFICLAIINVWVSALAFAADVEFTRILISVPIILIIMNLPISIGGIGLLEFAFIFTFDLIGYPTVVAVSTALLLRLKTLIDGGIGGLIYWMTDTRS